MKPIRLVVLSSLLASPIGAAAQDYGAPPDPASWEGARAALEQRLSIQPRKGRAKNVILFIGDGMGVSTVTATRIFDGQSRGAPGEENVLPFERFPHTALVKTYNVNAQVADSAGTASAIMTGIKTNMGVINMAPDHPVGLCGAWEGAALDMLTRRVEASGRASGVVTTARLSHATPATVYANSPSRHWEDDGALPEEAKNAGCIDIAAQLVDRAPGDGLEVAMGGGRGSFLPKGAIDPETGAPVGRRLDGRDLTAEWIEAFDRAAYVTDAASLAALDLDRTDHLLGLFEPSHMKFEADRAGDTAGEPSLAGMTLAAIEILSRDEDGFFLMVEGGRIDHAHHDGNAYRALADGQAFAEAVAAALEQVDLNETLVLVTADHSHVFTIAGYPSRGNPILGLVEAPDTRGAPSGEPTLAADGKPHTTLGYWNGPGAIPGKRPAPTAAGAVALDYRQQAVVPLRSETHGGEDVALYAVGPWAHLADGVIEQHVIYHLMAHAMGLPE